VYYGKILDQCQQLVSIGHGSRAYRAVRAKHGPAPGSFCGLAVCWRELPFLLLRRYKQIAGTGGWDPAWRIRPRSALCVTAPAMRW
jgi:hypothetical protein